MIQYIKTYYKLWQLSLQSSFAHHKTASMQISLIVMSNVILMIVWHTFFAHIPRLRNWQIESLYLLFGFSSASFGFVVFFFGGVFDLAEKIFDRQFDRYVFPTHPLLIVTTEKVHASGIGDFISAFCFFYFSRKIELPDIPVVIMMTLLGAVTIASSIIGFASLSFWFPKLAKLARQHFDALIIFSTYPSVSFSPLLRMITFIFIPSAVVGFLPVTIFENRTETLWLSYFGVAGFNIFITTFLYSIGSRRLQG